VERHFTATGFVVHEDRTLLLWHRRLQAWVPPGGHLKPNEDPIQAVLREIQEETGLRAEVIVLNRTFPFDYPQQLPPPYTILVERTPEPGPPHQHIDLIYFCRSLDGDAVRAPSSDDVLVWVTEAQLRRKEPLPIGGSGQAVAVLEDVRLLALEALRSVRNAPP
jgi:ADP-ribose pyrophosphatase YjhB (NUDIX family)